MNYDSVNGGAPNNFSWLPFGAGSRGCLGTRLGLTEVTLGIARLLKVFVCLWTSSLTLRKDKKQKLIIILAKYTSFSSCRCIPLDVIALKPNPGSLSTVICSYFLAFCNIILQFFSGSSSSHARYCQSGRICL